MATLNFPDPALTPTYTEAGITWTWNATLGVWSSEAGDVPGGGDVSVDVGDTRPSLPTQGDLWFCTAEAEDGGGRLYVYYDDADSGQWVDVSQPGGGFSGDYNDLINKPNIPDGFDLEDGSEINNLIVWRSEGEALTLSISGTDSQHPATQNITYTDMPTTATSGSGTGMTITYDAGGSGAVSNPVVSFPGSGYQPGDTFTVDGRDFGGSVLTTSSDAGDHPGPDGTSGWYPEAGQNYYVSTRVDSTVKSIPTFEAGFIGGRVRDTFDTQPTDGAYNFYATGNRTNNYINFVAKGNTHIRNRPTDVGRSGFVFYSQELLADGTFVDRITCNFKADEGTVQFTSKGSDDISTGAIFLAKHSIGFTNDGNVSDSQRSVVKQADNDRSLKFETPSYRYKFNIDGKSSDLEIRTTGDFIGLETSATTNSGEYGIHHLGGKTVSLKNSAGEIRLDTSGDTRCIKGSNELVITPGSTTKPTQIKGTAGLYVRKAAIADTVTRISSETALELQGDDPIAYQTTYSTDEDGNQVAEQEYIGTTETLLEIIRDLRARVEALEGA